MSKKVLILSGSPRKGGNSDYLCDQFLKGAQEAGHTAEKVWVGGKKIGFCRGCYACRDSHVCFQKDDMKEILDKMIAADVLVLYPPSISILLLPRSRRSLTAPWHVGQS